MATRWPEISHICVICAVSGTSIQLRNTNSIYIVNSGRINVAGMTETNMDALCQAIAAVL